MNLAEVNIYESISTVGAHDIFQKKTDIFDPQEKVGMESRFYIDCNRFQLYDVVK